MTAETDSAQKEPRKTRVRQQGGASEAVYGLGFIGALVYYLGHATTVWLGILGVFKAIIWPAILVYEMLKFLTL